MLKYILSSIILSFILLIAPVSAENVLHFYAAGGEISISEDSLLSHQPFMVSFAPDDGQEVVVAKLNNQAYLLTNQFIGIEDEASEIEQSALSAIIQAPQAGDYILEIFSTDMKTLLHKSSLQVIDGGIVRSPSEAVGGAIVRLYEANGREWSFVDMNRYGGDNPIQTRENGSYAWYIPNGVYEARAEHPDYVLGKTGRIEVKNGVFSEDIQLIIPTKPFEHPLYLPILLGLVLFIVILVILHHRHLSLKLEEG